MNVCPKTERKEPIQVRCVLTSYSLRKPRRSGRRKKAACRAVAAGAIARLRPSGLRRGSLRFAPQAKAGGVDRDRTDDLKLAKLALSQLSYDPVFRKPAGASQPKLRAFRPPSPTGFGAATSACFAA